MTKFIIDVNLPTKFSLWHSPEFTFIKDIDTNLSDSKIWELAKNTSSVIVTKDRDFYDRILQTTPPPKVIYIRFGNMKMREFHNTMLGGWETAVELVNSHKLVLFYKDRIEGIE